MAERDTVESSVIAEPRPERAREIHVVGEIVEEGTPTPSDIEITVRMVGATPVDLAVTETNAKGEKTLRHFRAAPEEVPGSPAPMIPGNEPWRWQNPLFQDKEVFDEYMKILEENRNAMFPDEDDKA